MRLLLLLTLLLGLCYACLPEPKTALRTVQLDQTMTDPTVRYQFYHPLTGWDSVPPSTPRLYFPKIGGVYADFKVADIVLNSRDSVRIGIIHPTKKLNGTEFDPPQPDYLFLGSYGLDSIPVYIEQMGVGPVSRRTFFRVGREYFRLGSINEARDEITIEPIPRGFDIPIAASINLRYKRIPVRTITQKDSSIIQQAGKELVVYFWGLGPHQGTDLVELDSLVRNIPPEQRPQVVAINRADSQQNLEDFLAAHDLEVPVYKSVPNTCEGLNCLPRLPYALIVNAQGRIINQNLPSPPLFDHLGSLGRESRGDSVME
ncbi:MAG: hypothetical protein AAF828_09995 [Bacteroidota bacterium]